MAEVFLARLLQFETEYKTHYTEPKKCETIFLLSITCFMLSLILEESSFWYRVALQDPGKYHECISIIHVALKEFYDVVTYQVHMRAPPAGAAE